jgi:4-amino-4-deoxy-L-arabinose transferase-like glycosyltransferase
MTITAPGSGSSTLRTRGLSAVLDYAQMSHARAVAILIVVAMLSFLPGFFQVPPIDRDEARFAQATKQMVESGDYVDIRFQNESRYKKPVGIYWLQAAVVKTASRIGGHEMLTEIWLYRLPSLLGAIGSVLLTYWVALAFVTRRTALLASVMMATCVLLGVEARLAKTDAMLSLTVIAAMGAMARVYLARLRDPQAAIGWTMPAIFWTAMAAGFLLKGPLIMMFVVLTVVTLAIVDRSARWLLALRPFAGILWMIVLVLPWFAAIVVRSGDSFFAQSLGDDMLSKVASSQEAHGAPPGLYFLLFWVTFWPAAVLAGMAAPALLRAWRQPGAKFLLAWLVPSWLVFELVVTKLPHYVLPLYPAIAIMVAGILESGLLSKARWFIHGTIGFFLFPTIIGVVSLVGVFVIAKQPALSAWPFVGAAMVLGLVAWRLFESDGPERALLRAAAASICVSFAVFSVAFPTMTGLFPSVAVAEAVHDSGCKDPLSVSVGYQEPSLVFLVGSGLRFVDGSTAADFLRGGPCRFAIVDARNERIFAQRAETIGARYSQNSRIEGYNISVGRPVTLTLYQSESDR